MLAERSDICIRAMLSAQMPDDDDARLAWERNAHASAIEIEDIRRKLESKGVATLDPSLDEEFDAEREMPSEPILPSDVMQRSFRTLIARIDASVARIDALACSFRIKAC